MKRTDLALLLGTLLAVGLASFSSFASECAEIRSNVVRLHILAHSDSQEDQVLKEKVRDALLERAGDLFAGASKQAAQAAANEQLADMEQIARAVVLAQGFDYPVCAELVNMYFDTRYYNDTPMAAGWYDAVRITIGSGNGQNWWCVMFPPICLPAAMPDSAHALEQQIEEMGAVTYRPRFALLELAEQAQNKWTGRSERPVTP